MRWEGAEMKCLSAAASWDASLDRQGGGQTHCGSMFASFLGRGHGDFWSCCSVTVCQRRSFRGFSLSRCVGIRTVCVHPMCVKALYFLAVLSGLAASAVLQVSGITIYTPSSVEAVNGTDVRLKCTFQSIYPINPDVVTVSWSFRPLTPGQEKSVFHYQQRPYPPVDGIFLKHIVWAGDIMGRDASITIHQVKFNFNGTYICQVKNPPDVHGTVGEIRFRVVTTASFSELVLLALAIGGGIAAVVILLILIVSCRRCKRRRQRQLEENEEAPQKKRKDPTEW